MSLEALVSARKSTWRYNPEGQIDGSSSLSVTGEISGLDRRSFGICVCVYGTPLKSALPTALSRIVEKLIVAHLVKKCPLFPEPD
jgi:hypothetical protein